MGLNLATKVTGDSGKYLKTATLRDFPLVAFRMVSFEDRANASYDKDKPSTLLTLDVVALDTENNVVLAESAANWSLDFGRKKDGDVFKNRIARTLCQLEPGQVLVGRITKGPAQSDPNELEVLTARVAADADKLAALEKGFGQANTGAPVVAGPNGAVETTEKPWDNKSAAAGKPPF